MVMDTRVDNYHVISLVSNRMPVKGNSLTLKVEFTQRYIKVLHFHSTDSYFTIEDRPMGDLYATRIRIFPDKKGFLPLRSLNFSESVRRQLGTDALEEDWVSTVRKLNKGCNGGMQYVVKVEIPRYDYVCVEEPAEKKSTGASEEELSKLEKVEFDGGIGKACCVICLEDLVGESEVIRMPNCQHVYHEACILRWLKENKTCPSCRSKLADD